MVVVRVVVFKQATIDADRPVVGLSVIDCGTENLEFHNILRTRPGGLVPQSAPDTCFCATQTIGANAGFNGRNTLYALCISDPQH